MAKSRTKSRQKELNKRKKEKALKQKNEPLIQQPKDPTKDIPSVNYQRFMRAVSERDPQVWDAIVNFLLFFEGHHYLAFGRNAVNSMNEFVACTIAALQDPDFRPNGEQAPRLVQMGHIFQHMLACCPYQNTTAVLGSVMTQESNAPKVMFLLNPRSELQLNQEKLFDAEPYLASLWYNTYMLGIGTPTKMIQQNIYRHLECMSERWLPPHHVLTGLYFTSTYHNPGAVRRVKSIINKGIQKSGIIPTFENNPDPNSIAIITNRWHRNHAVYKSASPLVEQLVGKYKLTLVWTGRPDRVPKTIVKDYFDKILFCYFQQDGKMVMPKEVQSNDFQLAYFPDIGMSDESVWLSNARIAPIQAVGYGHPDTTGDNNEIDYFIGGDVEKEADDAYSETRVLLPGLAQEPAWPTAERQYNYQDDGIVRINCVWGPDKYNHTLLSVLAEINRTAWQINRDSKHEFHLYGSPGMNRYCALPPFRNEISRMLPNAHVHTQWEYYDYMREAEKSDFAINSFPFGCYNTLIESLWMGQPILTIYGDRFYNRAGMWLNQQIGMDENNFESPRDLVNKAAELITNPSELKRQRSQVAAIDLKSTLFTLKGSHFLEAVEYIIANHPFTETKIIGDDK